MIEFSLWSLPDLVSIIISSTIAFFFFIVKSDNRKANVFLGLFLWSLSIEVLSVLLEELIINGERLSFDFQSSLFTIPLLYFYVRNCINHKLTIWNYLLLIPGILLNIFLLFNIDLLEIYFIGFAEYIFNLGILGLIYFMLRKHRKLLVNYYTELEQRTLYWIKMILYIFLGFHIIWILEDIINYEDRLIPNIIPLVSTLLTLVTIFIVAYNGFSQSEIFRKRQFLSLKTDLLINENGNKKELKSIQILEEKIKAEKYFLMPDLNLTILAQKLKMKDKELSGIINHQSGTSFYNFINNFRLEEFKQLLNSEKENHLSLLGLAQDSGFKSKSTFYDFFKKTEGITPNQYKKKMQNSPTASKRNLSNQ